MTARDGASDTRDRRAALAIVPVSRETEACFAIHVDRLRAWQRLTHLVAPSTLDQAWTRHVADSAQLLALAPAARRWVDLGSGAGFPGLVIAAMLKGQPGAAVHLIESNARKCAFLREVARMTEAPATVHDGRVEDVLPGLVDIGVVTSRAMAPLPALIALSRSALDCGAVGLFLSGEQTAGPEGDSAGAVLPYRVEAMPSRTHARARILRVSRGAPADPPA